MRYHYIEPGRFSINRVIFEWSEKHHTKQLGFFLRFENWEITIEIGLVIGTLWVSIPHKFLFKRFPNVFHGNNFGEWGREIGFRISKKVFEYSLWWYSNINKPRDTWRTNYIFIGKKK